MMTVRELNQLRYLKREVYLERERLKRLNSSAGYGSANGSDGSTENSRGKPGDRTGVYACEIAYLKQLIAENMKRCICELLRLQRFIDAVEDSELRLIMKERFIKCRSWRAVAFSLGYCDEQVPRRRVDRYVDEYNAKNRGDTGRKEVS